MELAKNEEIQKEVLQTTALRVTVRAEGVKMRIRLGCPKVLISHCL